MNTTMMIEPCCCERQAPEALRSNQGRATLFTNGDVTMQKWFNALSSLAGPNHRMTLVVQQPDVQMMRWLRTWLQRGWTTHLQLTVSSQPSDISPQTSDIKTLVAAELDGLLDRLTLAVDNAIGTELLCCEGDRGCVVLCGPMLSDVRPALTVYSAYSGRERGMMADLLSAVNARHRQHQVEMPAANGDGSLSLCVSDSGSTEEPSPKCEGVLASDSPTPKKKTKKK